MEGGLYMQYVWVSDKCPNVVMCYSPSQDLAVDIVARIDKFSVHIMKLLCD
jgi:hypothetical protein